jgi:hypothetical protein
MLERKAESREGVSKDQASTTVLVCLQQHEEFLALLESNLRTMETLLIRKGKSKLGALLPELMTMRETVEDVRNQMITFSTKVKKITPVAEVKQEAVTPPPKKPNDLGATAKLEKMGYGFLNDLPDEESAPLKPAVKPLPQPSKVNLSNSPAPQPSFALSRYGQFSAAPAYSSLSAVVPKVPERPQVYREQGQVSREDGAVSTFFPGFPSSFPSEGGGQQSTQRGKGQDRPVLRF